VGREIYQGVSQAVKTIKKDVFFLTSKGIDISKHNGKIDFKKVKEAGIDFAMIRAGFGASTVDERFHANIKGAQAHGIKCGVYWFSYAYTPQMARKEAIKCLDTIRGYALQYPVAFDFEYASVEYAKSEGVHITKALASQIADEFLSTVAAAGYDVLLYSNIDYLQNYFTDAVKSKYPLWLAAYRDKEPSHGQVIWQHTERGRVDGIRGAVDLNISRISGESSKAGGGDTVNIALKVLKKGSKGNTVKAVQQLLAARGYKSGITDGIFGEKTESAVKKYQAAKGLKADGIVGKNTYNALFA
jgi:GH25 family lysozyme M1 (1,4-beta-N-acetylmuramidase)